MVRADSEAKVILADLVGQQHALVDDGARGQRSDIQAPLARQAPHFMLHNFAYHKQLALEGIGIGAIFTARDEYLAHDGFGLLDALSQPGSIHRHIAPTQ